MDQDDFDINARVNISKLDKSFPDVSWNESDLWATLQSKQRRAKQVYWIRLSSSMAACIVMILSIAYLRSSKNDEHVTIRYTEETTTIAKISIDLIRENSNISILIEEQCRTKYSICQTTEFRDLKAQLEELDDQSKKLTQQLNLFGDDPLLSKAHGKIERTRSQVEKELLQMIQS